jgi:hypothetical protein
MLTESMFFVELLQEWQKIVDHIFLNQIIFFNNLPLQQEMHTNEKQCKQ